MEQTRLTGIFFVSNTSTKFSQDAALRQGAVMTIMMLEPILEQIRCRFILRWSMPLLPLRGY